MAQYYSADMWIGGKLKRSDAKRLWTAIRADGARDPATDRAFEPKEWEPDDDGILKLTDPEAAWGHFAKTEEACRKLGLRYVRWSEDGDRQVFDGEAAYNVTCNEGGETTLTAKTLERFSSLEAALSWLRRMDGTPPALEITA